MQVNLPPAMQAVTVAGTPGYLFRIQQLLQAKGFEVRLVGGSVRDLLLDLLEQDYDLATTATPDQVKQAIKGSEFKTFDTGLAHGTLTIKVTASEEKAEITTLRADIATDGRHATVKYGVSWQQDAARRDFTINALSLDFTGKVYDYFTGLADLSARKIRFVGNPQRRIIEDNLRILRFFRFLASHGRSYDSASFAACVELRHLLINLPAERIWQEVQRMLKQSGAITAWYQLLDKRILPVILPPAAQAVARNLARINRLARLEQLTATYAVSARLGILGIAAADLRKHWNIGRRLEQQIKYNQATRSSDFSKVAVRRHLLRGSKPALMARLQCYSSIRAPAANPDLVLRRWGLIQKTIKPVFPLTGRDLIAHGFRPGKELGVALAKITEWWLNQPTLPDRKQCLLRLRQLSVNSGDNNSKKSRC